MGKTLKIPKFHQTLHLVSAIARHGSLSNVDGSRPESMAKGNVKDPASHSQRISSKLSFQTGKRYMEMLTFREYKRMKMELDPGAVFIDDSAPYLNFNTEEAKLLQNNGDDTDDINQDINTKYSTKFSINLDLDQPENHYDVTIEWLGKGQRPSRSYDNHLLQQLGKRLFGAGDGGIVMDSQVPGCTSVTVDGNKYIAHPMFHNDHMWHDWVYIQWQGYPDPIPARIEMFFDLTKAEISNANPTEQPTDDEYVIRDFRHQYLEQKVYAVVWSAKSLIFPRHKITNYHIPLNLAFRIELEDCRRIIPVESFVKPCFGMLNACGLEQEIDKTAIIMKDRSLWSEYFLE
jgi:hypothetical protein